MLVPAGGPATINGIIYQMLWSLLETSAIHIQDCDADASGEHATRAYVVLEPSGGGGDTLVCSRDVTVVQQLKARSDGGTWSLRSLVHDVLPDLYRAVQLDQERQFQFITEGNQGDWKQAEDFFQKLASRLFPEEDQDVLATLYADRNIRFRGSLTADGESVTELSEQELFAQITAVLRAKDPAKQEPESLTHRKLWYLLSRLQLRWEQTAEKLRAQLQRRLRAVVDNADALEDTLRVLLMALAERASHGQARIEASVFFREHGLDAIPLTNWYQIVQASVECLKTSLSSLHYQASEDVRPVPAVQDLSFWQSDTSRFLVLAGESGQGKTWRLCALACALSENAPVVLLKSTGDGGRNVERAARLFWQNLCRHDSEKSLNNIAHRISMEIPTRAGNWLYLIVDNVLTLNEAKGLYEELAHVKGVCVAFSAPPEVAEGFAAYAREKARVLPIPDFADDELRHCVVGGDLLRWHDIPVDVRETIRRPLLASLYRDLTQNGTWVPTTEYDLFSRCYQQQFLARISQHSRMALVPMKKAALAVWEGQIYPWSLEHLLEFGVQGSQLDLLVEIGWLRYEDDRYEVWHGRLLNWQVAEALADSLVRQQIDPAEVGNRCADLLWNDNPDRSRGLIYVAMDLVWLLAQRGQPAADILDVILDKLDRGYGVAKALYEELLPTVGAAIGAAVFRRLEQAQEPNRNLARMQMAKTLATLETTAVAPDAVRLLQSPDWELRRTGAKVLSRCPSTIALNPLWQRYCTLHQDKAQGYEANDGSARDNLWERMDIWPALKTCIAANPEWLEAKIRQANPETEPVGALAELLCHVPDGEDLWRRLKSVLRVKVRGEGERQFAHAAYHWGDAEETAWLRQRVTVDHDGIGASCLRALIRIDPGSALSALVDILPDELAATRKWTFGEIMVRSPKETREGLYALMRRESSNLWKIADAFASRPDAMNTAIAELLLDDLFPRLEEEPLDSLWWKISRLADVCCLPLLRCLERRSGTDWEARLIRLIIERGPLPTLCHDIRLEKAVSLLYKMGGEGFTQVINHWLASSEPFARLAGIQGAFKRPDASTIKLLESLALSAAESVPNHIVGHSQMAQKSLAACGAWRSVVKTIVHWQASSNRDVLMARQGAGPLSDEDMTPATEALRREPKHPGAIIALGFGQRLEALPYIVETLNEENPQSYNEVTNACTWAMVGMQQLTPDAVEALTQRLVCSEERWLVVNTLCWEGGAEAARSLLCYFRSEMAPQQDTLGVRHMPDELVTIARHLLKHPSTSEETIGLCRQRIAHGSTLDYGAKQLVRALSSHSADEESYRRVLDSKRVWDFLAQEAFQRDGVSRTVGNKARSIRGLAAFGREEAYVAALRVLKNPQAHDREYVPYTLLEMDRNRAVDDLITQIASESSSVQRMVCARALCGAGAQNTLLTTLGNVDVSMRRAACFALGFAKPTDTVISGVRACLDDRDTAVYEASVAALHRLEAALDAEELASALRAENNTGWKWVLLEAALEIGELGDAGRPVPDWVQCMCASLPPLMCDYAGEKIKERRKKEVQEAEREDRLDWD